MSAPPIAVAGLGVVALLVLILRFKVHAFPALIVVSIVVGLVAGLGPVATLEAVREGMGGALGFIAVVVGLGSMLGGLLHASGGVEAIARGMLARFGERRAGLALGLVGLMVAIPVFFDVAFIILAPLAIGLAERARRHVMMFALPLIAGLAAAHSFVPPTPGPMAVAELLDADLGWVILFGLAAGLPAMVIAGPLFARIGEAAGLFGARRENGVAGELAAAPVEGTVGAGAASVVVLLPLVLILAGTVGGATLPAGTVRDVTAFVGHPFTALLAACATAYALFGLTGRTPKAALRDAMVRALEPAGVVILVTGAGGVFKEMLVDTGAGAALAEAAARASLAPIAAGFVLAALIRVAQGSATVAMITAGGLVAPIAGAAGLGAPELGLLTVAVASGATVASHVNDSGFWLVNRYLGLTELETIKSWTVASTLVGVVGFAVVAALSLIV